MAYCTEPLRNSIRSGIPALVDMPETVRRRLLVLVHEVITEEDRKLAGEVEAVCNRAGVPVFHSASGVALALTRYQKYHNKPEI